jgi:predicted dehydrogenase
VLFDLGPHLLDLADLAAGPIRSVSGAGDPSEALIISTRHEGGAIGEFLLSGRVRTAEPLTDIDLYGHGGHVSYSTQGLDLNEAAVAARREFALAVREGRPPTVDAHRALYVQRIIDAASRSLQQGTPILVD